MGGNEEPRPRARAGGRKVAVLAFLCSLVPGGGHMYLGLMERGLHLMVLFFGSLFLLSAFGGPFRELWSLVFAPVTWFYSFFEALQLTAAANRGQTLTDRGLLASGRVWLYVGIGLILLGAVALLNNLDLYRYLGVQWVGRLLLPAALLAVGVWLLARELGRSRRRAASGGAGAGGGKGGPTAPSLPTREGGGDREA